MHRELPSLTALRAFEAAGRHMSYRRAAEELRVTPAAIGQQIRILEAYFRTPLFLHMNRSMALTPAGEALLPGIRDGFERLARAVDAFGRRHGREQLTVGIEPSIGARWLVRRLGRFRVDHPGTEVRLDTTLRTVDFANGRVDLAVRYGDGNYPGLRCDLLCEDEVFPVCSPALLEGPHPLSRPEDLKWHQQLHWDGDPGAPTWPDWETWLQAVGVGPVGADGGLRFAPGFHSYSLMIDAALAGQGVALASTLIAADDIEAGRLVRPFDLAMRQSHHYYVIGPEATADEPKVAAFREWVIGEARGPVGPGAGIAARPSAGA